MSEVNKSESDGVAELVFYSNGDISLFISRNSKEKFLHYRELLDFYFGDEK